MARMSGIYGMIRRDAGPLAARDAALLGLPDPRGAAIQLMPVDDRMPSALHRLDAEGEQTVLVGHVDDRDALAARLALPPATPPATLARAALARYAGDTPIYMIGEWSLLHVDRAGRVVLMQSAALRDRIFYALDGPTIAVAPDLETLSRLPWVGRDIDATGLLFAVGRAQLRARNDGRTMLRRVRRLEAGECVTIDGSGVATSRANALTVSPRWQGDFADAVTETERLLRVIVGERMRRAEPCIAMLSGGLDSSTLAWLAAEQRPADARLLLITSVSPPDCSREDERHLAGMVASALGLSTNLLFPDRSVSLYRPADAILHGANGPPMTTRHGMTEPFQRFAAEHGAALMFNGNYGEMTLTAKMPVDTLRRRLRRAAGAVRRGFRSRATAPSATGAFNIRLARHRLAAMPDAVVDALAAPVPVEDYPARSALCGYLPGAAKSLRITTEPYPGAVREDFPYRDLRLLRLFAGFPAAFLTHGGMTRSVARHMLQGHLPDSVRLRTSGLPASPDHLDRLRWQAPAARARIAAFRTAGIDDWIDLDWLESALLDVEANGLASYAQGNDVQLTTVAAEYLLAWQAR